MSERIAQILANEDNGQSSEGEGAKPLDAARSARLKALYDLHWPRLLGYIRRAFGDGPPDPEDAVQYAFSQFALLEEPERIENPRAYLYRSAGNFVLEFKRRNKVRARFAASAEGQFLFGGSEEITSERIMSAKERAKIVETAIRGLHRRYRDALIMNRIHGMTFVAIAKAENCSESEARRRVLFAANICERALNAAERGQKPGGQKPKSDPA